MLRSLETVVVKKKVFIQFFSDKGLNIMKQSKAEYTGQHKHDVLLFYNWILTEANDSKSFV